MERLAQLRFKRWGYVFFITGLIYSTLYAARPACTFLRNNISSFDIKANTFLAAILIIAIAFVYKAKRKGLIKRKTTIFFLIASMFIYTIIILQFKLAEEKIHFFEYGILAFLIYRAFIIDVKETKAYIFSIILVFILGWVDEIIQYLLPNRYYELRDVLMNAAGGMMGLILTFIAGADRKNLKPKLER